MWMPGKSFNGFVVFATRKHLNVPGYITSNKEEVGYVTEADG
jgi:hypothetical protein